MAIAVSLYRTPGHSNLRIFPGVTTWVRTHGLLEDNEQRILNIDLSSYVVSEYLMSLPNNIVIGFGIVSRREADNQRRKESHVF